MWDFKFRTFLHDLKNPPQRTPATRRGCDVTGCPECGDYRAPKSRDGGRDYYWFCINHVREYNSNWDFFKGMSQAEMEHHLYRTAIWDRPTWRAVKGNPLDDRARRAIYEHFTGDGIAGDFAGNGTADAPEDNEAHININSIPHPTIEALAVMGLAPPVQWEQVKARYKALAKKHHPDTNKGDKKAEELFKKIALAYTIIKLSYQNYTNLDDKK
jgi:DnaJ-domain-containing protein 1